MQIDKVNNGKYAQCRIPGIVITEQGTLLAYYEWRKEPNDWADIDIRILRSTDGGDTWQTACLLEGKGETQNNPVMFVKDDEIHLLFLKNYKTLFHCVSTDDGLTFSEPVQKDVIGCDFFYNAVAVGPGHGIVHNGRMIVPIWYSKNETNPLAHRPTYISTIYSDDGENWHLGEFIGEDVLYNPSECALAITPEGRFLISIRNENECRQRAFALSDTGISGWEDLHFDPQMPDPVCMGSMFHVNGTIYHINCESISARENLVVKISDDGLKTFRTLFVDTPGGYSDLAVKDNTLYIFYERDHHNGGLYFKRITV